MNINPAQASLKYPLIIGGLTTAAGLAYLYYRFTSPELASIDKLSKEQVKKILREFRRDYYPILATLTKSSIAFQNNYKKRFNDIPDSVRDNLYTILVDENPVIKDQIKNMEDRIYSKYSISDRKAFEQLTLKLSKTDAEISDLINSIKDALNKAIVGISASYDIKLPDEFNPEFILMVYKDSIKITLRRLLEYIKEYNDRHGEIRPSDETFTSGVRDLRLDEIRLTFLKEKGFGVYEEYHPEQIYRQALSTYGEKIPGFKEKMAKLEERQQNIISMLLTYNPDINRAENEINQMDLILENYKPIKETKIQKESNIDKPLFFNNNEISPDISPIQSQSIARTPQIPEQQETRQDMPKTNPESSDNKNEEHDLVAEPSDLINPDIEEETQKEEIHIEPVSWINIKKDESVSQDFIMTDEPVSDENILTSSTLRDPEFQPISISIINKATVDDEEKKNNDKGE